MKKKEKVHFIGIGGIGVSAIARMYLKQGARVTGSDRDLESPVITELRKLGAKISRGHRASHVPKDADLVVHTIAITTDNPELVVARKLGLVIKTYPEVLGELSAERPTIAIAGTHGKTTTTAMVAEILVKAKLKPMVIVGSLLQGQGDKRSNFIAGTGPLVVEACEYRRSFMALNPTILVITNIDADHLDYYRDLADIQKAFADLVRKLPPTGTLICDTTDRRLLSVIAVASCPVIDYRQFDKVTDKIKLRVLGEHNRLNASAALAVGKVMKISPSISLGALNKFKGTWRRLEDLGRTRHGARLYDDYGHHPTAIQATLKAIREELKPKRLIVIFQPHLYSRTKSLLKEFSESFTEADEVFILPIYEAREESADQTVSSEILAKLTPHATYTPNFTTILKKVVPSLTRDDLLLTIGAGDIFVLAEKLRYNH